MAENYPAIDAQRKAHPDAGETLDQIEKFANEKLFHQMTDALMFYYTLPAFDKQTPDLVNFFDDFVKPFSEKLSAVRLVQLLGEACKHTTPKAGLDKLIPFEETVKKSRDAVFMWKILKGSLLTKAGDTKEAKQLVSDLESEIEKAYAVTLCVQSYYHFTCAELWWGLKEYQKHFSSAILYLAYTKVEEIPEKLRVDVAVKVGTSAILSPDEYNFGELMQQPLMAELKGTDNAWFLDLLKAFHDGGIDGYDKCINQHKAAIGKSMLAPHVDTILKQKMILLALLELAFVSGGKKRVLAFDTIAQACRVQMNEVELIVMKAMSKKLIRGTIDEVSKQVAVLWCKPRILDNSRMELLRQRIDTWASQSTTLLHSLEELTPELLVS